MTERWYQIPGENDDIIVASRIRLLRNFEGYRFPSKMSNEERRELSDRIGTELKDLYLFTGNLSGIDLSDLEAAEKEALHERLLINKAALTEDRECIVYASTDEAFSMTVNGTDHLRLILSFHGQGLQRLYERMCAADDFINMKMPYAFSPKFGYKTAQIGNVGTGMRAYYVMHLPLLSEQKSFQALSREMIKYGVVIKEAWNEGTKKIAGLYVLYNQRTMGLSEQGIMDLLSNVAEKLMHQERELRASVSSNRMADRVFRSYGILKYASLMELSDGLRHLSNLMLGVSEGYLRITSDLSLYELMLGIHPGNLQGYFNEILDEQEMKEKRAEYLREFMKDFRLIR